MKKHLYLMIGGIPLGQKHIIFIVLIINNNKRREKYEYTMFMVWRNNV